MVIPKQQFTHAATGVRKHHALSDKEVRSAVHSILRWDTDVDTSDLSVAVSGGTVTLSGSVPSFWQRFRAVNLTSNVSGVRQVENRLAIVPTLNISDELIAKDVSDALHKRWNVDENNIDVKVIDGEVTLTGTVHSWTSLQLARYAAWSVSGVTNVDAEALVIIRED